MYFVSFEIHVCTMKIINDNEQTLDVLLVDVAAPPVKSPTKYNNILVFND